MKTLNLILFSLLLIACKHNGGLEEETQSIELTYIAWGCECANWSTIENLKQYAHEGDSLAELCIFMEPENSRLELPDTLAYNNDLIRFTGKFYKKKGFPEGFHSIQNVDKARVFRYSKYEVLRSGYGEGKSIE